MAIDGFEKMLIIEIDETVIGYSLFNMHQKLR